MKILHNGKEIFALDLGIVKIGESKEYRYTLENESKWDVINIELSLETTQDVDLNEIKFVDYPKELKAHKKADFSFVWTPSIEIKSGLKTQLQIKALEIWK